MTFNLNRFNNIHHYLRNSEAHKDWKRKSFNASNSKCVITGRIQDLEIHHLNKPFAEIVTEALNDLNLPEQETNKYTSKQLFDLEMKMRELHEKYGLGIVVHKNIHTTFHRIYGKKTTKEDFYQFKKDWRDKKIDSSIIKK